MASENDSGPLIIAGRSAGKGGKSRIVDMGIIL